MAPIPLSPTIRSADPPVWGGENRVSQSAGHALAAKAGEWRTIDAGFGRITDPAAYLTALRGVGGVIERGSIEEASAAIPTSAVAGTLLAWWRGKEPVGGQPCAEFAEDVCHKLRHRHRNRSHQMRRYRRPV